MRNLNGYSDWEHRRDREIALIDSETRSLNVWFFRVFILFPIIVLVLIITNELLGNSYKAKGTVVGFSFSEGEWVGPPSMFSDHPSMMSSFTHYREDAYNVSALTESGEVISFLCFSCKASSYKSGDSVDFIISKPLVGRAKYSEAKK
ncbi:hypothetical protein [Algoriphagus sp. Y33]|uniref:hypothetical protein n=1 Tax=Algoriphagus sp. Y33 TaxID=2772483 RepID=UPI001784F00D|nr:hypothetical protein [Algoriphagus sp. Y33]